MSGPQRVTITPTVAGPDKPEAAPTTPTPTPAEKPKWLPDKFWNADKGEANYEALATSYGELEKKQGAPKPQATPEKKEGEQPPANADDKAAREAVTAAGLDFDGLSNEFYSNGDLSKESRAKIVAAGIPESMIDSYLAGVQLQVREFTNAIVGHVGGAEQYAGMTAWAQKTLSDAEIKSYNDAVNSGDYNRALTAVKALKADYIAANGKEPELVGGGRPDGDGGDVYTSWAQVTKDMALPAYKKDKAFRASVEAKLSRSKL